MICVPSGDQAGSNSGPGFLVSCRSPEPSTLMTQISKSSPAANTILPVGSGSTPGCRCNWLTPWSDAGRRRASGRTILSHVRATGDDRRGNQQCNDGAPKQATEDRAHMHRARSLPFRVIRSHGDSVGHTAKRVHGTCASVCHSLSLSPRQGVPMITHATSAVVGRRVQAAWAVRPAPPGSWPCKSTRRRGPVKAAATARGAAPRRGLALMGSRRVLGSRRAWRGRQRPMQADSAHERRRRGRQQCGHLLSTPHHIEQKETRYGRAHEDTHTTTHRDATTRRRHLAYLYTACG